MNAAEVDRLIAMIEETVRAGTYAMLPSGNPEKYREAYRAKQSDLRTALLAAGPEWLPIDNTARNGRVYLLSDGDGARAGSFYGGVDWTAADNICEFIFNPTHYMPYNPPAAPGGEPQ